ncbi:MAG: peptidylprolyl isomerase [Acidimicrobiales bacterium]
MSSPRARREQERQRRLAAEEARRRADRRTRRNQRLVGVLGLLMIIALVAGLLLAAGRSGSTGASSGTSVAPSTAPSSVPSTTVPEGPPVSIPAVPPGATLTGPTPCPAEDGSSPRTTSFAGPPPTCVEKGSEFIVTIRTPKGDIKALVSTDNAPAVVNNFIVLARYHYWDGAPISLIKSRSWFEVDSTFANPPGVTSPGYTIDSDAPPQAYTPVTLGMAVEPGTKKVGGTMVVGIGEQVVGLPQTTPVIGLVLDGADAVRQIGQAGTQSGQPTEVLDITTVIVEPSTASATTSTTTR